MALYTIENDFIRVDVESFGAEIRAITEKATGRACMWNAGPEFWKRTSPVLFPIVGSLKNGEFRCKGQSYKMSQHGFARDSEFNCVEQSKDKLVFELRDSEESLQKYPYHFALKITYVIDGNSVKVIWEVTNTGEEAMSFAIGGHPAFMTKPGSFIKFDSEGPITSEVLMTGGVLSERTKTHTLTDGYLPITDELFAEDALIIEGNQAHRISLCDENKSEYLTVEFDAPLFGLWSPAADAPFVCIEPWYGRCDRNDFAGELFDREYNNCLAASEVFKKEYKIIIG